MSMRPGEKVLAAPEELGLDSRTVFRRAATELLEQLSIWRVPARSMTRRPAPSASCSASCSELLEQLAEGAGRLVIDLAGTRQIDSAGLGALMLIQRKAAERRLT